MLFPLPLPRVVAKGVNIIVDDLEINTQEKVYLSISEILYGILFEPVATLQYLSREKPVVQGLLVFLSVSLFNVLIGQGIAASDLNESLFHLSSKWLWAFGVIGTASSILVLLFMAGFFSLLSEIIFGQGNAKGLLACLSFASVPGILGAPLQYAALLIDLPGMQVIFPFLAFLWVVILQLLSLREALGLQKGQALLLFILPSLILLALGGGVIALLMVNLSLPLK
ncbi:MAG: Yip1 family protein [Syntrophomonas sp.]